MTVCLVNETWYCANVNKPTLQHFNNHSYLYGNENGTTYVQSRTKINIFITVVRIFSFSSYIMFHHHHGEKIARSYRYFRWYVKRLTYYWLNLLMPYSMYKLTMYLHVIFSINLLHNNFIIIIIVKIKKLNHGTCFIFSSQRQL